MPYTLIGEKTLYKQVVTKLPDYLDNGIIKPGEETISYTTFNGWTEAMDGEESKVLANGNSNIDSQWLFTTEHLNTYKDYDTDTSKASVIYLTDPEQGRKKAIPYVVFDRQDWDVEDGFELLTSAFDYIIIRQDKLK